MKTFLCTFLLLWQAAATSPSQPPQPKDFRYLRTISAPAAGQSCVMLDPSAYAHSGTALKDLRIYPADQAAGTREVPYAVTLSEPVEPDTEQADVMNLGMKGQAVSFDLAMPARPYTEVTLDLDGQDFLATATVWGKSGSNAPQATRLGEFTLFDLTSQRLARNTTLAFQESTFPYLHVEMTVSPATAASAFRATPQMVNGATVPPSRDAQAVYTLAAETSELTQKGRQTIAKFTVPERVPVERVSFVLAPEFKANFSRDVDITSRPAELAGHPQNDSKAAPLYNSESVSGTILRVHLIQAGREVRQQELSIPATLGSNLQGPATVEVAVNNGDDAPLPIKAVRLEMRERRLCFDAPAPGSYTVFYGNAQLTAPEYDYARLFQASDSSQLAQLGPEQANPLWTPPPDTRSTTERHPELVWIALLAVICVLALVALRSSKGLAKG